jgi:sulfite exporter TauE/SafE
MAKLTVKLKTAFGSLLQRRTIAAPFALGAINGLLPCGLVYVAAAGAAATAHPFDGALHMAAFGAGTLPMMLGLAFAGARLRFALPLRQLIPISVTTVAVLLVLRGLGLGIPYLSPALQMAQSCH